MEAEEKERNRLDAVQVSLKRIDNILDTRRAALSLGDVMLAAGKTEAAKILRTSLNEKLDLAAGVQTKVESFKGVMEGFTSPRRSREILTLFRSQLAANALQLDVRLDEQAGQSITGIKTARGSEGPRALLAYYYAFLHTRSATNAGPNYPLVIDAPNQQGQDAVHLPRMLMFIFEHAPPGGQVIVATEDVGNIDLTGVLVRTYGERKRQVLRESEYRSAEYFMKPFTDAILASTAKL